MRDKNLMDGIKCKDRADLLSIRFFNTVNFGIITHKDFDVPDILTILEEVIPCLHTGDCYNMSDESTKCIQYFDRPPYSLTEIR